MDGNGKPATLKWTEAVMNDSRLKRLRTARVLLSEAVTILDGIRFNEDLVLFRDSDSLPEDEVALRKRFFVSLEEATDDLVNVEEWLESARA